MALITITPPAIEPVSLSDVKTAARIDGTEFDTELSLIIPAMRMDAEHILCRRLITQTVELVLDEFPSTDDLALLLPDVQSVVSVKYVDKSGAQITLDPAAYSLDSDSTPCWLLVLTSWPSTYDAANAVRVRYIVGYGPAATDVPNNIRLWIIARSLAALDKKEPSAWIDRLLDAETVSCAA